MDNLPEVWLRGPVSDIPDLLQPVAHTLLQAIEEIKTIVDNFPPQLLWEKPAGMASVGFHLQHIAGVLDRLFTYAEGKTLTRKQLDDLAFEGSPATADDAPALLTKLETQISLSLQKLSAFDPKTLTEFRGVGRKQLPSTVLGLLFHSAEHTMRHTGQLLVTARIVSFGNSQL